MTTIVAARLQPAVLSPPLSKSDAQRALVLAHACAWPTLVDRARVDDDAPVDVRRTARGLQQLAGPQPCDIDCGDGGAPFRLLLAQAAVTRGVHARFIGTTRLAQRPHGALLEALERTLQSAGLTITSGDPWPIEVRGPTGRSEPRFVVSATESSQYASAILLAAATLAVRERRAWAVDVDTAVASAGYLDLTESWMRRCGLEVTRTDRRYLVSAGTRPAVAPQIPGDWSSLGYLLLVAWRAGAVVADVDLAAAHPDREVLAQLDSIGLSLAPDARGVRVLGRARGGLRASAAVAPDLIPTLAALACTLEAPSVFSNVGVLRLKESDRLAAVIELVRAAGATASLAGDTLTIAPPLTPRAEITLSVHGDHRMAMCAAVLSVLSGARVTIDDPTCVEKSFPSFWTEVARAGVQLR